jgi:transcriptional/translational regulatory protein YebC/TACO1
VEEGYAQTLLKFMDTLDDNEDVQNIAFNFEISDEIMAKLES